MNVKIGDIEYKVAICVEHEDMSPKTVKETVQQKADEIERLKEMAAKFGMVLNKQDAHPQEPLQPKPQRTAAQPSGHRSLHQGLKKQPIARPVENTEPQAPIDQPLAEPIEAAPSDPEVANLERYSAYNTRASSAPAAPSPTGVPAVPKITAAKNQIVKTESGREVIVPSVLYDDQGSKTTIKIVSTGGDKALQSRFKDMADASKGNRGPDFRNHYNIKDCMACGGTGISRVAKNKPCPKCGGDGFAK